MLEEDNKKTNWFLILLGLSCLAVIASAFYFLYYEKNYEFLIEVACDPSEEVCSQRDCTNPDDCPPNELSEFKRYSLRAADFEFCENEDCESACESGIIQCELVECEENLEFGESCTTLNAPVETPFEDAEIPPEEERI